IIVPRDLEAGTLVFHAGTLRDPDGTLRVHGGRVLTVTGLGDTVAEAARRSSDACELISFQGKTYRRDIGWREIREARAGAARGGDDGPGARAPAPALRDSASTYCGER